MKTQIRWVQVADFTYVSTAQGFAYVAFVIDLFARRICALENITPYESTISTVHQFLISYFSLSNKYLIKNIN